jgi:hypothetical protein
LEDEVYFVVKIRLNFTLYLRLRIDRNDVAQKRQLWFRIMSDIGERYGHWGKTSAITSASPVPP